MTERSWKRKARPPAAGRRPGGRGGWPWGQGGGVPQAPGAGSRTQQRRLCGPGRGLGLQGHGVAGTGAGERPQGLAQGRQEEGIDPARVLKAHLGLGGVDVDVQVRGGERQVQHRRGMAPPGQEPREGRFQHRPQDAVLDHPAVHQEDLETGAGQGKIRVGEEPGHLPGAGPSATGSIRAATSAP